MRRVQRSSQCGGPVGRSRPAWSRTAPIGEAGRVPRPTLALRGLFAALGCVLAVLTVAAPAGAAPPASVGNEEVVEVVEVSGLLDPVLVDFVEGRIDRANERGLRTLVLRFNSPGAVVPDERIVDLARRIRDSEVPVAIWVGPSNAQARGAAAQLVAAARPAGIAPGARIGATGAQILPADEFGVLFGDLANRMRDSFVGYEDAVGAGLREAPSVGDFVIGLDGVATREVTVDGVVQREPATDVRFVQLSLGSELLHTVASPAVAYLLLVMGLGLLLFELYTAGIGLAGLCGAAFTALGCYGLGVLPFRTWALVLLVGSFIAFAVDVQTAVPRLWTWIGVALFAVGTVALYDGVTMSWVPMVSALALTLVVFLRGMPAMVRSRFSVIGLGREWLVGEGGVAATDVAADGVVVVRGAQWPARSVGTADVTPGDRVTVVDADGVTLLVTLADEATPAAT